MAGSSSGWCMPVVAVLIVALFGRGIAVPITLATWTAVANAITSTTFALSVAAIWLGCSLAVADAVIGALPAPRVGDAPINLFAPFGKRVAVLVSLCALGSVAFFAIVYWGSGLSGVWLSMYFVVLMTALIGLFLGLIVSLVAPKPAISAAVLLAIFIVMAGLGGQFWPLPGMSSPMKIAACASPARWAFEGLLLLESAEHQAPALHPEWESSLNQDFEERLFPSSSDRMGVSADALALGLMLIGMAALAAFIWAAPPVVR